MQSAVLPPPVAATTPGLLRTLLPQLIWEAVLLVGVIVVLVGLTVAHPGALTKGGANFAGLAAILGFMAAAFALSVRTGTPNLAVATIGGLCGYLFAKLVSGGTPTVLAGLVAVLAAIGFGLVMALIAGLTALPAWAVTLAVGFVLQGVLFSGNLESIPLGRGLTSKSTWWMWVAVFAVVSIAGAVAFAIPAVRAALSRNRAEPGGVPGRFTPGKLLGAAVGLIGSSALAGFAGVLSTERQGAAFPSDASSALLVYALAAVLLAGVSPLGGRGGVLGVVLAVLFIEGVVTWLNLAGAKSGTMFIAVGVIAVFGLLLNWLLELIGRLTAPKATT